MAEQRITAEAYAQLAGHAQGQAGAGGEQFSRLLLARERAAARLAQDSAQMARLAEINPDLMVQVKADLQKSRGQMSLDNEGDRQAAERAIFGDRLDDPQAMAEIGQDPAERYRLANQASRRLSAEGRDPRLAALVKMYQEEAAGEVARDPHEIVRLGSRDAKLRNDFLHDIRKGDLAGPDATRDADLVARRWIDQDRMAAQARRQGVAGMSEVIVGRRQALAQEIEKNPAALFALGQKGEEKGVNPADKFRADRLQAAGPERWGRADLRDYDRFHERLSRQLGDQMNDPVARYASLQQMIGDAEFSGKNAKDLAHMRQFATMTAQDIQSDPELIGGLVKGHPELKHNFVRDTRGNGDTAAARESDAQEAARQLEDGNVVALNRRPSDELLRRARLTRSQQVATVGEESQKQAEETPKRVEIAKEPQREPGVFSASARRPEDGSLSGEVVSNMPTSPAKLATHLKDQKAMLLALPTAPFTASGAIDRELKRLAKEDPAKLKRLYQNTVNAKVALFKSGNLENENDKLTHDRLELGRRAMAEQLVKRGLMRPEETAADMGPLMSRMGENMRPEHRRDPGGHMQAKDLQGRIGVLNKMKAMAQNAAKGLGNEAKKSYTRGVTGAKSGLGVGRAVGAKASQIMDMLIER